MILCKETQKDKGVVSMSSKSDKRKPHVIMENILKDIQELHSIFHSEIFALSERVRKCKGKV